LEGGSVAVERSDDFAATSVTKISRPSARWEIHGCLWRSSRSV